MKIKKQDFLIEIGTAELPPNMLNKLILAFADIVQTSLTSAKLEYGVIHRYATPRRLALFIEMLASEQPTYTVERKGPALSVAFDSEGKSTSAAQGFARSCGVSVEQLQRSETPQGVWLIHRHEEIGQSISTLMPDIIQRALENLPIPKPMRWGNHSYAFIRPVHWMVMLYGESVIPAEIFGITSGNQTYGHRFLHKEALPLKQAKEYEHVLRTQGYVIADFNVRKEDIRKQVKAIADTKKANALIDEALLEEVTALVEWPVAIMANFEERFLEVPQEALMTSMQQHQRCFPMVNEEGKLLPHFITISNIESTDPKQVIMGNERVMRARLSDAAFFYQTDCKRRLDDRVDELKSFIFQTQLGSMYDKTLRVATLSLEITKAIDVANAPHAERAGFLAKADLLSTMVGEFPELQGVMGSYYAMHDGEPAAVAQAIGEHYLPRFSGDNLPGRVEGCAVAIADRLDTLVGIFGIHQAPTGDKDPFALRRAAIGVLRIMIEKHFNLDCVQWLQRAYELYSSLLPNADTVKQVRHFMFERLRASYLEQGIAPDVLAAVLATEPTRPYDFHQRLHAVTAFRQLAQAKALSIAHKRVSNILIKENQLHLGSEPNPILLIETAEKILAEALKDKAQAVAPLYKAGCYAEVLTILAELQTPVDQFFDAVMVMVEDEALRKNRLVLLTKLRHLFLQVADISLLQ